MYKSPYKISIWDTSTSPESKLFDIGSDTMESLARAIEPKLVRNINGKKSFSFKMYKTFTDENGNHDNPYIPYLINERLVKVYWDDEWYDFVIKNVVVDSAAKVYTIQCEDWCVQELSKQGFNLEFDEKLMNNQGTITELASKALENTNWSVDTEHTSVGYEYNKEAVYEIQFSNVEFTAQHLPSFTETTIQGGRGLVFFSCVQGLPQIGGQALIQFVWTGADTFETETGSMMVVDSEQYNYQVLTNYTYSSGTYTFTVGSSTFIVNTTYGTSTNYRAKRLINSIRSFYNPIVDKYCNIAKNLSGGLYTVDTSNQLYIEINNELYAIYLTTAAEAPSYYEFKDAEYNFAKYVQNLIANGSKFTGTEGWRKVNSSGMEDLVPVIDAEHVKSYLNIPSATGNDWIFNLSIKTSANFVKYFIFGEVYYLRIKLATGNQPPFESIQIADYTSSSNYMIKSDGNTYFNGDGTWVSEGSGWYHQKLTCVRGLSLDSLIDSQVGLFFHSNSAVQLEEAQLFKEVLDESSEIITPGEFDSSGVQKMIYCAYNPEDAPETKDDIVYIYKGDEPIVKAREGYAYLTTEFQKVRTINVKESNIFNILQTLAEKFEAWCVLVLEHDESGVITSRKVKFVETVGNDSNIGFVYGLDLKGVKRTVDSKEIVTKTIVKQNSNKYADNGFCTIMRAQENFPRTNYILNFDYYVNQGLIDNEALNEALNSVTSGSEGYYVKLNEYNTAYDAAADKLEEYQLQYDQLNSYLKVFTEYKSNAESQKYTGILNLFNLDDLVGGDTSKESLISLWNSRNDTSTAAGQWYTAHIATNGNTGQFKDAVDRDAWKYNAAITNAIEAETKYDPQITNIENTLTELKLKIANAKSIMDTQIENIKEADIEFAQQYGRFIQEGTWSSEEYMSDTLYYLDALDVAYTSARPRVTYSIDVLRLRALPGYELRRFNLGDISYVEDTEFFGYTTINGVKTPFHEPVVLTELTESFDDPSKDQFKVQNYRTQFEDLFQRITASTQTLQWNEADYGRAVSAVQKDQTINTDILQGTFNMAQDLVRSSLNNAVTQDATGITIINQSDPSKQSHIVAEGFFISTDGGINWRNAVSAEGVATELLTAGAIDTNRISIKDGSWEAFRWDSSGLNAYKNKSTGARDIEYGTFVRFDKWGIYGVNGKQTVNWIPSSENEIITDPAIKFSLTWSGLNIKSSRVVNGVANNIAIGDIDTNTFGIRLRRGTTDVFLVDDNGHVKITGELVITSGDTFDEINAISSAVSGAASGITTEQQYCASTNSTTAIGNWQNTIPETDSTHPYIFTRLKTVTTPIQGTVTTTYTPSENGTYDVNLTNTANAAVTAQITANGAVRSTSVKTQYYLSTSQSSATGGSWSDSIPDWVANKYLWTRVATTITPVSGSASITYTPSSNGAYDKNLTKALSDAAAANAAAQAAQTTANGANSRSQRIYYRKTSSGAPATNTTWLESSGTGYGNWSLKIPPMTNGSTKYPYLYTAVQTQTVSQRSAGSSCSCSPVLLDDTTTVIDGGNIITGTVTANAINAGAITLQKLNSDVTTTIGNAQTAADNAQATANNASTAASNAQVTANAAQTTANAAQTAANGAAYREQIIYRSIASGGTAPTANTTWVTDVSGGQNKWTVTRPTYSSSYPVLYIALQRQTVQQSSGTGCSCTTPQIDNTTTVIDGGHITTGTIDANVVTVSNLNASNITTGALTIGNIFSANKSNSTVSIGGFSVSSNSITAGTWGSVNSVMMCTGSSTSKDIGGSGSINGWCFTAGANFGVTKEGALYCNSGKIGGCTIENGSLKVPSANITGEITANALSVPNFSASSGGVSIGGFTVDDTTIYNGNPNPSSLSGVGMSRAGGRYAFWSVGPSGTFTVGSNGALSCTGASISGTLNGAIGTFAGSLTAQSLQTQGVTIARETYAAQYSGATFTPWDGSSYNSSFAIRMDSLGWRPVKDSTINLGSSSNRWLTVYARTSSINTSSRKHKTDIQDIDIKYETFFDSLKPRSFLMSGSTSIRRNTGFILDEVGTALQEANMTGMDFAGYCLNDPNDPLGDGGLRYEEFIAINTWQVQKLKERVSQLETQLQQLQS